MNLRFLASRERLDLFLRFYKTFMAILSILLIESIWQMELI